ncbi:hypothetical protein QUF74_17065 [Candidatus Halobeggiatoa sp. HSG11]|nr:hypothetical protein [Candidatus Halobeggiatoa sp. HSG11]
MSSLTRKDTHVVMTLIDGAILKGTLVIERTSRLSDTLNKHDKDFIVLSDYEDNHHIINKHHIIKVIEVDSLELEE